MKALQGFKECPSCGDNHKAKSFFLYENGWFCFSCHYTKASDRLPTIRDSRTANSTFEVYNTADRYTFSLEALQYLNQYYITEEIARDYGIRYLQGSLLYPIRSGIDMVGYQRRWLEKDADGKRRIAGEGEKLPTLLGEHGNTVILVEDYISAVRVSQHYDTVCLWGTKCSYEFLKELLSKYETVLVWLDNDETKEINSGQEAAKKICKMADSILVFKNRRRLAPLWKCGNIVTNGDPKTFSDTEIKQIVEGALP